MVQSSPRILRRNIAECPLPLSDLSRLMVQDNANGGNADETAREKDYSSG